MMKSFRVPLLNVDSDIDEVIWPNRCLLASVGLWPLEPNATLSTKLSAVLRFTVIIIAYSYCIVPLIIAIYIYWGDVAVLVENGVFVLGLTGVIVKVCYLVIRRSDFRFTYTLMQEFWSMAVNQQERNEIVELTHYAKVFTIIYTCACYVTIAFFIINAFVMTSHNRDASANASDDYYHKLPFGRWYGVATQTSPGYEFAFIIESLSLILGCPAILGPDLTAIVVFMHEASQFRLISLRLKVAGRKLSKCDQFENAVVHRSTKDIISCIIHHQKVLGAFQFVEELFGPFNFFQLLVSALEICFTGMIIVQPDSDLVAKVTFSSLLVVASLQLMICCWSGEVIIRESREIGHALLRDIPWYDLPTPIQQHFKLIVCRSQKPCEVTAIGFQIMSLKKMSEVFNTALSYMALLRSVKG